MRWLEAELPGARGAFTTRIGGVSAGPYAGLNLGLLTDDEPERVRVNRERAAAALGITPGRVLIGHQVHGTDVRVRDRPPDPNPFADTAVSPDEADGQASGAPDLAPLVFVADCLPVLLSGDAGVAALHCGWRGLAGGIVERGVAAVDAHTAAVGPGIEPCCYEVGEEVSASFAGLGEGVVDGRRLDLALAAQRLLERAGVEAVERAGLCTACDPELFFSHRRDGGVTGRQAGLVWADAAAERSGRG